MNHKYVLMNSRVNYSIDFPKIKNCEKQEGLKRKNNKILLNGEWNITQLLSMLPKKKPSDDFDRKMAAAFSMELERDIQQRNSNQINKKI